MIKIGVKVIQIQQKLRLTATINLTCQIYIKSLMYILIWHIQTPTHRLCNVIGV